MSRCDERSADLQMGDISLGGRLIATATTANKKVYSHQQMDTHSLWNYNCIYTSSRDKEITYCTDIVAFIVILG